MDALPPSPWSVLYNDALLRWLDSRPDRADVGRVDSWLQERRTDGPPEDASVFRGEDEFIALIPGSSVRIRYLLVQDDREQLIIVKEIR